MRRYNVFQCLHEKQDVVKVTVSGGAIQLRKQCRNCGDILGNAIAKAKLEVPFEDVPYENPDIREEWNYKIRERAEESYRKKERERKRKIMEEAEAMYWQRRKYEEYLLTEKWRNKERLVLKRANHICEGCGENEATKAAHKSYNHIGTSDEAGEFLFELVALCEACHQRLMSAEI